MNDDQAGSKFIGVSPVEKLSKEGRNEEKDEFSVACGIVKKIVREENEIEKNENESEDGSKVTTFSFYGKKDLQMTFA